MNEPELFDEASNPNSIKNLRGSESRDTFKWAHKKIGNGYYASDADLVLAEFHPRGIVAYIDFKKVGDIVTATEKIIYDEWVQSKPVFVVEGIDPEFGPFTIYEYLQGGQLKFICCLKDQNEYRNWELSLRMEYKKNCHRKLFCQA